MKVFLDTNIILDFYDCDRGHYLPTAILFDLAFKGRLQLTVCAQSFINSFYILRKFYPKEELYRNMQSLFRLCQVSAVDATTIENALNREGRDFEDSVQYFSSKAYNVDIILTRDRKGFTEFDAKKMTAEDFLDEFLSNL